MLGYNSKSHRFIDKATGRFISRSRGLLSSIARQELKQSIPAVKAAPAPSGWVEMPYEALERAIEPRHAQVSIDIDQDDMVDFLDDWSDYWIGEDDMDLDQEDHYSLEGE